MTEFGGGEPQGLDNETTGAPTADGPQDDAQEDPSVNWDPPDNEPNDGPLHAWSVVAAPDAKFLGKQSVELKTLGNTFKTATMVLHGSDPSSPSSARIEFKQYRRVMGGFDFDAPPESKFYLEDEQIQVLKAFLEGQFLVDGYYIRLDSKEMATEVAKYSAESLGGVLAAISDKQHLIDVIEASGHADFLADYVTNERKRVEIGHLETAVWDPDSHEGVFQKILERNPWMFGGEFVATIDRTIVLGEQYDVPLVTADGSLHLVELKKANASPIIRKVGTHWMVGGPVHEAVCQTQNYLRSLDEERHRIKADFGIDPRRLHATVVIGHIDQANSDIPMETIYETLRTYNSHMTRITVMTYDQLVTNARNSLEILGAMENPELDNTDQDGDGAPDF